MERDPDATGQPGRRVRRIEDARFIRGRGRYTDDIAMAGRCHAVFVRSPHAHARLEGIVPEAALAIPGVLAVFTAKDLLAAGVRPIGLDLDLRSSDGSPSRKSDRFPLARDTVRYMGEPVALVLGDTLNAARDGAEAVQVDYAPLDAVVAARTALGRHAPDLWPDAPGNVALDWRYGSPDAVAASFRAAAHVVTLDLVNQRVMANPIEPRSATAQFDPVAGRYLLECSHQTPHSLRTHLAQCLSVREHRIRVVSRDMGGAFGARGQVYPEEVALLAAARLAGRPIGWRCERSEAFGSDAHARDHDTHIRLALDGDAALLAIEVDDLANLGAYISSYGLGPPVLAQTGLLPGPYRVAAVCGRVRLVYTNTVPVDAYRGPGRAETTYMVERALDCAARQIGLSPVELRRRNLVTAAEMPYRSATGRLYDSGDLPAALDKAVALIDAAGFEGRRAAASQGQLRGLGFAMYIDSTGIGPSPAVFKAGRIFGSYESAELRILPSGGAVVVTGTHAHGQGLDTSFAQIVAHRLGLPLEDVEVRHGDTDEIAYGHGTIGSRSLLSGGAALAGAVDRVIEKGRSIAARYLDGEPGDVVFEAGHYRLRSRNESIPFDEIARHAYFPADPRNTVEPGLQATCYFDPTAVSFPNGCHVCELEVDEATGAVTLLRYAAVDDFGNEINPMIVDGQVHGGVMQGIGQALREACRYSLDGQIVAGSFMDYAMPRAADAPSFELARNPHPCATNPLGVKGCAEAGTIVAPAVIVGAVVDALRAYGVRHIDMPLTAEAVWRSMRGPAPAVPARTLADAEAR